MKKNPSRHEKSRNEGFLFIFNEILEGIHIKENPSKNERNPGMKEFSVISNYMLKGSHTKENPSKNERNPGMKDFSVISNEILKGIHIKENPSRNEKSRNEGFSSISNEISEVQGKIHPKMKEIQE